MMRGMVLEYFQSLINPFEHAGCKLGWGCMVPTIVVSTYLRTTVTANSDGSAAISATPAVSASFWTNTSGLGGTTWGQTSPTNASSINTIGSQGRCISFGIRAYPNLPMTNAPGVVDAGALVIPTASQLNAYSPSNLVSSVTSHMSIGYAGAVATGRPIDPETFSFYGFTINSSGYGTGTLNFPMSTPYIVFSLGSSNSGCTIYSEFTANFEITGSINNTVIPDTAASPEGKLSDFFPTFESMWSKIAPSLPHPGRAGETAAASDSSYLNAMWDSISRGVAYHGGRTLASVARSAVSRFGSGQRFPAAYSGYEG